MNTRTLNLLLTVVAIAICIFGVWQTYTSYSIKKNGKQVTGVVMKVSSTCYKSNNRIDVNYNAKEYSVPISPKMCYSERFKENQKIQVIYFGDGIILPESVPEYGLLISIIGLLIMIYLGYNTLKR